MILFRHSGPEGRLAIVTMAWEQDPLRKNATLHGGLSCFYKANYVYCGCLPDKIKLFRGWYI